MNRHFTSKPVLSVIAGLHQLSGDSRLACLISVDYFRIAPEPCGELGSFRGATGEPARQLADLFARCTLARVLEAVTGFAGE
jgi:hypothetical protein